MRHREPRKAQPAAGTDRIGLLFVVVSAVCFGAMAIMARVAYAAGVDTPTLLALRFAIAAACMFALAGLRREKYPQGSDLAKVVVLGGAGYGGQAFTFFTALTLAPASLVALLLYLHPALVALLAALVLHERMTAAKLAALAMALAGMVLTVGPALAGPARDAFPSLGTGVLYAVAAAVIYSFYIVAGTRIAARVSPLALSAVVMGSAAVVFMVAALALGPKWPQTPAGWLAVTGIALISTVIAIALFFAGLGRIGATRASTLSTVEPVVTVLLAALLLDERIALLQVGGGALILGAVLLLARAPPLASDRAEAST